MPEDLRLIGSFVVALVAVVLLVPCAIRLALRTGFLDLPAGYKGHMRATPYLGGLAVVGAVGLTVFVFGVATSRYAALLIWALVLFVVGTVDDKRNLNPLIRLAIEAIDRKGLTRGYMIDARAGEILAALGRSAEAEEHWIKALDANPRLIRVYIHLGTSRFRSFDMNDAWRCFDAARRVDPASPLLADITGLEARFANDFPDEF